MNDVFSSARSAGIAAILICILTSYAAADDNLVFDFGSPRKFSGLGLQLWPATSHLAERDALLRDLRCKFVRVGFSSRLTDDQVKNHMSVAQISAAINKVEDEEETTTYSQLHDEISQLHLKLDLVFWQVPAVWCISSGDSEISHARINPDNIQDYANWIVAHLLCYCFGLAEALEMGHERDASWLASRQASRAAWNAYGEAPQRQSLESGNSFNLG